MARNIHILAKKLSKEKTYRQLSANRAFLYTKERIKKSFSSYNMSTTNCVIE